MYNELVKERYIHLGFKIHHLGMLPCLVLMIGAKESARTKSQQKVSKTLTINPEGTYGPIMSTLHHANK